MLEINSSLVYDMKDASSLPPVVSALAQSWFCSLYKGKCIMNFPSFPSLFQLRLTTDLCVAWKLHSPLDAFAILFFFDSKICQ